MNAKALIEQVRRLNNSKDPIFNSGWKGACDAIEAHLSHLSGDGEKPTDAMIEAGARVMADLSRLPAPCWNGSVRSILEAALAVSPLSPQGEWRDDGFGQARQALYLHNLYVGSIMWVGGAIREATPWRGWFMNDDEGNDTGWYRTDDEARASVEAALRVALAPLPSPPSTEQGEKK